METRDPEACDLETCDPATCEPKTRDPKEAGVRKARSREARVQEASDREARVREASDREARLGADLEFCFLLRSCRRLPLDPQFNVDLEDLLTSTLYKDGSFLIPPRATPQNYHQH